MHSYAKLLFMVIYTLLLALALTNRLIALVPLALTAATQIILDRKDSGPVKSVEVTNALHSIIYNHGAGRPLIKCALAVPQQKTGISRSIRKIAKRYLLGASGLGSSEAEPWIARSLENAVERGLESGRGIEKEIKLLEGIISRSERVKEQIETRSKGMVMLARLGIIFFFPLFSGISLNIIGNSLGIDGFSQLVLAEFTAVVAGYMAISVFVSTSLSGNSQTLIDNVYQAAPYLSVALILFIVSSHYLVYAL